MSTKFLSLAPTFPPNSRLTSLAYSRDTSIWCPKHFRMNMPKTELLISYSFHPVGCVSVNDVIITSFCSSQNLSSHPWLLCSSPPSNPSVSYLNSSSKVSQMHPFSPPSPPSPWLKPHPLSNVQHLPDSFRTLTSYNPFFTERWVTFVPANSDRVILPP